MQNVRVGLSICVAGVATTNRVGHAYTKKVWHCPVLVKVTHKGIGHIRRPKIDANLVDQHNKNAFFMAAKQGKLQLKGF